MATAPDVRIAMKRRGAPSVNRMASVSKVFASTSFASWCSDDSVTPSRKCA
jgi:hypothetical protein